MVRVNFYELDSVEDKKLYFAVIMSRYKGKWVFVRHKERKTWEIPGGHREQNENIYSTASRELIEETGAANFIISPVCIYSVENGENESFGQLFYSEIDSLDELSNFEIGEIKLFDDIPKDLTYPHIQPYLFQKIEEYHRNNK